MLSLVGWKSVEASPTTVDDDGPADFHTIQEAINNASSGEVIFVHKGTYYENVVVNKTVSLIGEERDSTIIDGRGTNNVISITASNVTIHGFTIRNSGSSLYDCGILIDHSDSNNISHNTISNNNDGISLYYSSNNLVTSNTISENYYNGIVLYSSTRNVFSSNTVSNNYFGVSFYYSSNNVVSSNTILDNQVGIYPAFDSNNNTIYHNNFNNFEKNVQIDSINAWDYEGEGNYWSDYTGQDLNRDGLGDTPYIINAYNQDNHPLMGIFSSFTIALERKMYSVIVISNSTVSDFRFEIGAETGNKIIRFNATYKNGTLGFCRVTIPTELMKYPLIVLSDSEEIIPTLLDVSNETHIYLYFTCFHKNQTITMIYSEALHLYYELLDEYVKLQTDFYDLNATYYDLVNSYLKLQMELYTLNLSYYDLLNGYLRLQTDFYDLNATYYDLFNSHLKLQVELYNLNITYYNLLNSHIQLLTDFYNLNETYYDLVNSHLKLLIELYALNVTYYNLFNSHNILSGNYTLLQRSLDNLNASYQNHLIDYSENLQNIRSLVYIFAATTAIFIMTTIYLSKRAHAGITTKTKGTEEEKGA